MSTNEYTTHPATRYNVWYSHDELLAHLDATQHIGTYTPEQIQAAILHALEDGSLQTRTTERGLQYRFLALSPYS